MDPVTQHVLRMLEDDTMGAPASKAKPAYEQQDELLTQTKDHPIGDVSGKVKGPGLSGGGLETASQGAAQEPSAAKPSGPNGMKDALLMAPNAMGRMARMKGPTY